MLAKCTLIPLRMCSGISQSISHLQKYGNSPVTVQNLEILRVDAEKNLLYVKGAIPGPNRGLVYLRQARKRRTPKT